MVDGEHIVAYTDNQVYLDVQLWRQKHQINPQSIPCYPSISCGALFSHPSPRPRILLRDIIAQLSVRV